MPCQLLSGGALSEGYPNLEPMTDELTAPPALTSPPALKRTVPPRRDAEGRAFAGSQMCLQVWVNRRQEALSAALLQALSISDQGARVTWKSPLEGPPTGKGSEEKGFKEFKDGQFLEQFGLRDQRPALRRFWPTRGPVWDGLAVVKRDGKPDLLVMVEAKSYPREVYGSGCAAGDASRKDIKRALDATAAWLGIDRPDSWLGSLYQSANRIAHVFFLRETLGCEAVMVNVCFTEDVSIKRPTTKEEWAAAKGVFREALKLDKVATPWLVDLVLEAPRREELLAAAA